MLNARELHVFLETFSEMCRSHPRCEDCELLHGECLCGGWEGSKTVEQVERVILAVERWKAEKGNAKRELRRFVKRLAEELDGVARIEDDTLVIDGSGACKIRIELGGDDGKA